ncbi:MAG: hypothetical protein OHK0053_04700 [Microscillaceae bacterium]
MVFHAVTPADGRAGFVQNWKSDFISGFLVFLIALPLCLGISLASGFPPISGIFSAIIGGLLVSFWAGSHLTIKGPAAGLIAIALASVETFNQYNSPAHPLMGYQMTLGIIVLASILQIVFGLARLGRFGDFFPASVIHGMLAAIGIIIFSKQIHTLLGVKPAAKEPLELLAEVPNSFMEMNPEIALIGLVSLSILFLLPLLRHKYIKMIPAPMLVLVVAVGLGFEFDLLHEHKYVFLGHEYKVGENYLVSLPSNMLDGITFPVFSHVFTFEALPFILMFSLVGSIESMLTVKAIDGLDPYQRKSDMNKDLVAVGLGNLAAGVVGGLPMISEVVRSSANVNNGAKTRFANFFHGVFLLIFVAFFPGLIHQIPLAALAAMLVYTGYRLASPKEFKNTYQIGLEQLAIFITTLLITLATDLLLGVMAGILFKIVIHLLRGAKPAHIFKATANVNQEGNTVRIEIANYALFTNFLGYKKLLSRIQPGADVILNFEQCKIIDHTFLEHLHHFEQAHHLTGGTLDIEGIEKHKPFSYHPLAARRISSRSSISALPPALMTPRQKDLQVLAAKLHCEGCILAQTYDSLRIAQFTFFGGKQIKTIENRLTKQIEGATLEFMDVVVSEGARNAARSYKTSILFISHIHDHFPDFRLENQGFLDNFFLGQDINFTQFPTFSKRYLLRGHQEVAIRQFFDEKLILFFEQNPGFQVETKGDKILIHRDLGLTPIEKIVAEFRFAEEMFGIFHQNCEKTKPSTQTNA